MRVSFVAAIALGLSACGKESIEPPITCLGAVTITPTSANLAVSDTIRAAAPAVLCGARYAWWWKTSNAAVATVDSASGLVRARGTGITTIIGIAVQDANVRGAMAVQVRD